MVVSTHSPASAERSGDVRELRLALVCYGGVSLAVYMHGVTKELHKLALASAAYEEGGANPFGANDTAHVYYDLLARLDAGELGARAGARIRVVIDVVSGTSAGGINGICLAKALAQNCSLDSLRDLWFEKGDIGVLLSGPRSLPVRLRALATVMAWFTHLRIRPPLRGDAMCVWLHDALTTMDHQRPNGVELLGTLLPVDRRLDLFVPVTDFGGYTREVPIEDPKHLQELTHRYVLQFATDGDEHNDFSAAHNHMLAFAARATSSFPGAFPPITIDAYRQAVNDPDAFDGELDTFFPAYRLADNRVEQAVFIDGGVLDNFPFSTTIDAIANRAAETEVERQLLYIEPSPSPADTQLHHTQPNGQAHVPNIFATVWGGIAGIPRDEPILDDLVRLGARNEAVRRVRDIIETSFDDISTHVHDLLADLEPTTPTVLRPEDLVALHRTIDERVAAHAGFAYETYLRLRVADVLASYAGQVSDIRRFPPTSYHAEFVSSILRCWVRTLVSGPRLRERRRDFLNGFDLRYLKRRIQFLIAAFSWWYHDCDRPGYPTRAQLDAAKAVMYDRLTDLRSVTDQLKDDNVVQEILADVFDERVIRTTVLDQHAQAESYVSAHEAQLAQLYSRVAEISSQALPAIQLQLHHNVLELIAPWTPPVQGALLTRYLGFAFWDALVFPVQALTGVAERDTVDVVRVSPRDATLLQAPDPAQKLAGTSLFHFGAFFTRPGRERDYLWGRLDAAERLITILLHDPKAPDLEPPNRAACAPAFMAILDEERPALSHARELIEQLQGQMTPTG